MVPTDPMREWMAPYSKYALLNQGPQTRGSHLKVTAQTAVCALANIKTSQCFSRNLFEGGQFLESLVVSYFDCKLLSINVSSSNSTEDLPLYLLKFAPVTWGNHREAMTWFLKDQEQHTGSGNWLATVPRMYSELEPYQSLAVQVQKKPTLQLKATPWKSIYRTALLAQDKNPAPGL